MKTCTGCGETKPLTEYHRNKNCRDGRHARCKECTSAQKREYYTANRETLLERRAEYYSRNRDAVLARQAEYSAEYYARPEVKAHRAEYHAEYYTANRETLLERHAEYYAKNPHVRWEHGYRVRAKKYGFEPVIEPFTKDELVARWGDACVHCGGPFEELDHYVTPVVRGGTHTIENCRPSCTPCNAKGRGIRRTNTNETENQK